MYYDGSGNTYGSSNVAVGSYALYWDLSGNDNVAIGYNSLNANSTGYNNTAIGYNSGSSLTTGFNCTLLGSNAQPSSIDASNEIVIGDGNVTLLRCNANAIMGTSDIRDKKDIVSIKPSTGIQFVRQLNPVDFVWNMRGNGKKNIPEQGFIAQELQQLQEETGIRIPGLVYDNNPERLEASYGKLIPIMVQAIKDLKNEIDQLNDFIKANKNM
jgi:hypothetical protein